MAFSLGSLFGSNRSVPQYNTKPLKDILDQSKQKQTGIAEQLPQSLAPINQQFEQKQATTGNAMVQSSKDLGQEYLKSLSNPMVRDEAIGRINQNAFRNVPAAQQMIKESLAGTGRLGNGRATNLLAQPVLQAAQQAGDLATNFDVNAEQNRVGALGQVFGNNASALASKYGLDEDTAKILMENGRGDLIQKAANLLGIEGDYSQGLFNLENTRQQSDIASSQADIAQRNALRNALLGIGGQVAGSYVGGKMAR